MKTIDKILKLHNTNYSELAELEKAGLVNGIGGADFNIELYVKGMINKFTNLDKDKKEELFKDLRTCANIHDKEFMEKKGFIMSNLRLSRDVYMLLHWTNFKRRLSVSLGVFLITTLLGRNYYYNTKNTN